MKRFLAILLVCLTLCAVCAMGASAAGGFNANAVQECIFLNDTKSSTWGHCGMVLVDQNGAGRLYSYQTGGLYAATLSSAQLTQFLKDGLIPNAISDFQFNKALRFNILPEEGRRMYDYAETHEFKEFFMYSSFFKPIGITWGDNCLTFVRAVMMEGSSKYAFLYPFGLPAFTFFTLRMHLGLRGVSCTTYSPG